MMNRKKELEKVAEEITNCSICQENSVGKAVPGEGNNHAKVMFVGEAPGKLEAQTGRPFVGRSGQLLRKSIGFIGLSLGEVYITSVCKYLPITGTPTQAQIRHGRYHLVKQIDIIQPKLLVLLGSVACKGVLERTVSIAKEHGTVIVKNGLTCFISYHPAAAIRFPKNLAYFDKDFQKLKDLLTTL